MKCSGQKRKRIMSSVLSDQDIQKAVGQEILIEPFDPSMIRPSSIRLRIGSTFLMMLNSNQPIDTQASDTLEYFKQIDTNGEPFVLPPKTLVLAPSFEKIGLSPKLTGLLNTISSLARIGL